MTQIQLDPQLASVSPQSRAANFSAPCDQCGNVYDKAFQIMTRGRTYTFDCFECAIARIAPSCDHCKVRIIGHGLESGGRMFCCDHCAEKQGVMSLVDRS